MTSLGTSPSVTSLAADVERVMFASIHSSVANGFHTVCTLHLYFARSTMLQVWLAPSHNQANRQYEQRLGVSDKEFKSSSNLPQIMSGT